MDIRKELENNMQKAYYLALGLTGSEDVALEVFQESASKVLARPEVYDESRPFWPWFARVVRNAVMDRFRQQSKRADLQDHHAVEAGLQSSMEMGDLRSRIQGCVGRLDEPYKSALVLVDMQAMSYEEAAQVLGTSTNTLGVWLYRARKEIRELALKEGIVP